eukprot:11133930-Lingulodinium_polyedra.AAC.1
MGRCLAVLLGWQHFSLECICMAVGEKGAKSSSHHWHYHHMAVSTITALCANKAYTDDNAYNADCANNAYSGYLVDNIWYP